jgi:AcrR family transcriptional regulator
MPRPTLTDGEVETVREKICDAAKSLFSEHGLENVGLRAIGSQIGLTGAALYRYFPQGREQIVAAVRTRAFKKLADISKDAAEAPGTPLERFRAVAEAYVAFARSDAVSYRMLFNVMQTGDFPALRKEARRARTILFRAAQEAAQVTARGATRVVTRVVTRGDASDGAVLAHVAWAAIHGAVMLDTSRMLQMGVDVDQLLDGLAQAISHLNGTSEKPARPRRVGVARQ